MSKNRMYILSVNLSRDFSISKITHQNVSIVGQSFLIQTENHCYSFSIDVCMVFAQQCGHS